MTHRDAYACGTEVRNDLPWCICMWYRGEECCRRLAVWTGDSLPNVRQTLTRLPGWHVQWRNWSRATQRYQQSVQDLSSLSAPRRPARHHAQRPQGYCVFVVTLVIVNQSISHIILLGQLRRVDLIIYMGLRMSVRPSVRKKFFRFRWNLVCS